MKKKERVLLLVPAVLFVLLIISCGQDVQDSATKIKAERQAAAESAFRENRATVISEINKLLSEKKFNAALYRLDYLKTFNDPDLLKLRERASVGIEAEKKRKAVEEEQKFAAIEQRGKSFLKNAYKKRDDIERVTWYYDTSSPRYTNSNGFFLYIGKEDGNIKPWFRLRIQYTADNWLFIERVKIAADDFRYDSGNVRFERGNGGGVIWEWYDGPFRETELVLIDKIVNAKKAVLRLEGQQHYVDKVITETQKQAMRNVLAGYGVMASNK